jgi:hypothetical protein
LTKVTEGGLSRAENQTTYSCSKEVDNFSINTLDFYPNVSVTREYLVEIIVMTEGEEIGRSEKILPVIQQSNDRTISLNVTSGNRIDKMVEVPLMASVGRTDIVLAYDQSRKMNNGMVTAKTKGKEIMNELKLLGADIRYALVSYEDYPIYNLGITSLPDYLMRKSLTSDTTAMKTAIDKIYSEIVT